MSQQLMSWPRFKNFLLWTTQRTVICFLVLNVVLPVLFGHLIAVDIIPLPCVKALSKQSD